MATKCHTVRKNFSRIGVRTRDPWIAVLTLYRLSYAAATVTFPFLLRFVPNLCSLQAG